MKNLKYIAITFLALVCTTLANGELSDTENSENPIKLTIFGHTGQDPVYKSIIDKPGFSNPKKKTAFVSKIVYQEDTFSIVDVLLDTTDWLPVYSVVDNMDITVNELSLTQYSNQSYDSEVFGNSMTGHGSLPTPPAFLLLLAGLTAQKRRK